METSWAGTFRREFLGRIHEEAFALLYSDVPSRPNVPVNVLVSLDTLKAGFGWSDEELHDHFLYDLQVRYALGYENLAEGDFELRTLYNFRHRLSQYNIAHGTEVEKSQRHRRSRTSLQAGRNPRAAVESTVGSIKHPFPASKLPVRGLFRVTCLIVASAAMTNVGRIQRYLLNTRPEVPDRLENHRKMRRDLLATPVARTLTGFLDALWDAFRPSATPGLRLSCA